MKQNLKNYGANGVEIIWVPSHMEIDENKAGDKECSGSQEFNRIA